MKSIANKTKINLDSENGFPKPKKVNLQPKNHRKSSMQTVLPTLDKDFDKELGILLSVPPSKIKELKAKWKKEREEKKRSSK